VPSTPSKNPSSAASSERPVSSDDAILIELFGGVDRLRAFRVIFSDPQRWFFSRDFARCAGIDPSNTSRWLRRWAEVGLLEVKMEGKRPAYRAGTAKRLLALRDVVA
jgi:hypothetical protein